MFRYINETREGGSDIFWQAQTKYIYITLIKAPWKLKGFDSVLEWLEVEIWCLGKFHNVSPTMEKKNHSCIVDWCTSARRTNTCTTCWIYHIREYNVCSWKLINETSLLLWDRQSCIENQYLKMKYMFMNNNAVQCANFEEVTVEVC